MGDEIMPLLSKIATKTPSELISSDEWNFIVEVSNLFPDRIPSIEQRFEQFIALTPQDRLKAAQTALKLELRRGFTQRIDEGLMQESLRKDVESIHDHSSNMRLILRRIFNRKDLQKNVLNLDKRSVTKSVKKAFRLASIHDMPEAITSDFTPTDMEKISRDTKSRLEDLASRIIFEVFPKKLEMIERYEQKENLPDENNIDHLNKVTDMLEGVIDCLAMDTSDEIFNEWVGTVEQGLKKYPELSLCFAKATLTNIRKLRPFQENLVTDYPEIQDRRKAIIELAI